MVLCLLTISSLLIIFLDKNYGFDRAFCDSITYEVPERVDCPSFNSIQQNQNIFDVSKSVFCRYFTNYLCEMNFSSNPEIQQFWQDLLCNASLRNINTSTIAGTYFKKSILSQYKTRCYELCDSPSEVVTVIKRRKIYEETL